MCTSTPHVHTTHVYTITCTTNSIHTIEITTVHLSTWCHQRNVPHVHVLLAAYTCIQTHSVFLVAETKELKYGVTASLM